MTDPSTSSPKAASADPVADAWHRLAAAVARLEEVAAEAAARAAAMGAASLTAGERAALTERVDSAIASLRTVLDE